MPYTLRFAPETQRSIRKYVGNADREVREELYRLIKAEFDRFARLPTTRRRSSNPGVPLHRFRVVTSDGVGRYLQFTYRYAEDEESIQVTSFGLVPM
jgi:hypothetical protein